MNAYEDTSEFDSPTVITQPEHFVENLIIARKDRGLTREDMAGRLNEPVQSLRQLELLTEYPNIELMQRYARVLGMDVIFA